MSRSHLIPKTVVLIPAHNEEGSLPGVIQALHQEGLHQILVIDNASTDSTARVASEAGARVVFEPQRGYGQACWTGLQHLPDDGEWILFCDADGCDDLPALPRFFKEAERGIDLILGNRRATDEGRQCLTLPQRFGNRLAGFLMGLFLGRSYQDLGPMRLIRRSSLEALQMEDRGFGWTVEMQAKAPLLGLSTVEIPVAYHSRKAGKSKISGTIRGTLQAGSIILATLGKIILNAKPWATSLLTGMLIVLGAGLMAPWGDFKVHGVAPAFWWGAFLMASGWLVAAFCRTVPWGILFAVALLARLLLLPMEPGTDVWRYIWEGTVVLAGENPYTTPPNHETLVSLRTPFWTDINHPTITAIYPPLTLLLFAALAGVVPSLLGFKIIFILADLATGWLLYRSQPRAGLLWLWNPLVIYTFAGGAHYDSIFVLAAVVGWLAWNDRNRPGLSSCALGFSTALKYMTGPLLVKMWIEGVRQRGFRSMLPSAIIATVIFLSGFAWFWWQFGIHPFAPKAFSAYARSAEFFPRMVEWFWPASQKLNVIYLVPIALIIMWRWWRARDLGRFAEEYFFALFLLSPVIHPWYFTWALPFACLSRNLGFLAVSLSAFVYFQMEDRQTWQTVTWRLTLWEWLALWLPLIIGFTISRWRERTVPVARTRDHRHLPTAPSA